jgi:hypothetical protein
LSSDELRGIEKMKIDCAEHHVQTNEVDYDVEVGGPDFREKILTHVPEGQEGP